MSVLGDSIILEIGFLSEIEDYLAVNSSDDIIHDFGYPLQIREYHRRNFSRARIQTEEIFFSARGDYVT